MASSLISFYLQWAQKWAWPTKSKLSSKHYAKTERKSLKPQAPKSIGQIPRKLKRYIFIPTLAQVLLLILFLDVPRDEIVIKKNVCQTFIPT